MGIYMPAADPGSGFSKYKISGMIYYSLYTLREGWSSTCINLYHGKISIETVYIFQRFSFLKLFFFTYFSRVLESHVCCLTPNSLKNNFVSLSL